MSEKDQVNELRAEIAKRDRLIRSLEFKIKELEKALSSRGKK